MLQVIERSTRVLDACVQGRTTGYGQRRRFRLHVATPPTQKKMNLEEQVAALIESNNYLQKQVAELTADRDRFLQALVGAAEMALNNNVTAAMMPKDMRRVLTEYVKNQNGKTTQKASV